MRKYFLQKPFTRMSLFLKVRKSVTNLQFLTVVNAQKLKKGINFWEI